MVVTGASSGIGRALACHAADRGAATVVLVSRGKAGLDNTARACAAAAAAKGTTSTCSVIVHAADVTSADACIGLGKVSNSHLARAATVLPCYLAESPSLCSLIYIHCLGLS